MRAHEPIDPSPRTTCRRILRAARLHGILLSAIAGLVTAACALQAEPAQSSPTDIVFKNATVMTASHGTIEHGAVWVHAGKIAGVGATVNAPASASIRRRGR